MNQGKPQCWVIPKRPLHLLLGYTEAGMVLYALIAVRGNLTSQWATRLHDVLGVWGMVAWAAVGAGLLVAWYGGVNPGRLNP